MARIELLMPKMGESIIEATILKWVKKEGEKVELDETILEIATDKVDSEIPSPASGILTEILYPEQAVVSVGHVIAIINTEGEVSQEQTSQPILQKIQTSSSKLPEDSSAIREIPTLQPSDIQIVAENISDQIEEIKKEHLPLSAQDRMDEQRFYSPLVKNIAKQEKISMTELETIPGSGAQGRLTKEDLLQYLDKKQSVGSVTNNPLTQSFVPSASTPTTFTSVPNGNMEIIEMDRMRRIIADHMVMSKQTSPHVTSFVEADVTNLVLWREKNKRKFEEKYGENITFTPLFIDAVVRAIKDHPMVNISLEGNKIIVKKDINIGIAAALPTGNLIVPVIKNADLLSLAGLAKAVNDLAGRARQNKLKPDEIKDGTFTITNVGTFGNLMGTPIINQPQVAILATGVINKKPVVVETEYGDVIAIRRMMFLSLSYDHRIVDGFLGGTFLRKIADYLEKFDQNTPL
jgi:2-oxoglutarate dehydrogenase E2 component (dihydrolipoamide succinyltransferase)